MASAWRLQAGTGGQVGGREAGRQAGWHAEGRWARLHRAACKQGSHGESRNRCWLRRQGNTTGGEEARPPTHLPPSSSTTTRSARASKTSVSGTRLRAILRKVLYRLFSRPCGEGRCRAVAGHVQGSVRASRAVPGQALQPARQPEEQQQQKRGRGASCSAWQAAGSVEGGGADPPTPPSRHTSPCVAPTCTDTSSPLARLSVPISRTSSWAHACSTSSPRRPLRASQQPTHM